MKKRIFNISALTLLFILCCIGSTNCIKAANRTDTTFSFTLNPTNTKKRGLKEKNIQIALVIMIVLVVILLM